MPKRACKITNPLWLSTIATHIVEYCTRLACPSISYETLYAYFTQIIQFGKDVAEFHVVFDEDNMPWAFGNASIRGLPYIATVLGENIYSWDKEEESAQLLIESWLAFGKRHRCVYFEAHHNNMAIVRLFERYMEKLKLSKHNKQQIIALYKR